MYLLLYVLEAIRDPVLNFLKHKFLNLSSIGKKERPAGTKPFTFKRSCETKILTCDVREPLDSIRRNFGVFVGIQS